MASDLNHCTFIGNLGKDPEVRQMQNGKSVCNLSIATSESWTDKQTGERKEKTEWHKVAIFNEHIAKVAGQYLKKGAKVYLEGALQTRKYIQDGVEKYSTEVVLQGFDAKMVMLGGREQVADHQEERVPASQQLRVPREMDDEIPF